VLSARRDEREAEGEQSDERFHFEETSEHCFSELSRW
jgi:hypothetical protein